MNEKYVSNAFLIIIFCIAISVAVILPMQIMGSVTCAIEWSESKMDYKYNLYRGCMVKTPSHGWIREKYFRTNGE